MPSLRSRSAFLAVVLALVAALSWGLEEYLSDPLHREDPAAVAPDPAGRRLYILLVDSLAPKDVETMPEVAALRTGAFSTVVEPCADNYTYPCTYEALTGRTTFSLFSFLDNMGVLERDKGANLIRDAKGAGRRVAVISRGDMDAWGAQADTNLHYTIKQRQAELAGAIEAAAGHDLVFHHYVWHDVISHRNPRKTKAYQRSLRTLEGFIVNLAAGLPDDMDLLITGDHGHLDDGRHLQGLDTPTELILRSPNVVPQRLEGRMPISAVRWLSGAVMGLGSDAARVAPEWRAWAAPTLGATLRESGAPLERDRPEDERPVAAIVAAALLGLAGFFALGWGPGLAVAVWGMVLGLAYPSLHEANLEGGGIRAWIDHTIYLPVVGGLLGLARRRDLGAGWLAAVLTGLGFGLALLPVKGPEGILRNAETILIPGMICGAMAAAAFTWQDRAARPRRMAALAVVLGLVAWASMWTLSFKSNDVRLIGVPFDKIRRMYFPLVIAGAAAAAGGLQALVRPRPLAIAAAAGAVVLGTLLPTTLQLVAFLLTLGGLVLLRGERRWLAMVPLLGMTSGFMFKPRLLMGILVSVFLSALALRAASWVAARGNARAREAVDWMGALALSFGSYVGLAWTLELSVAGIDFGFIIQWLPEGWHETLWWLITAAVFVKTFLPLFLLYTVLERALAPTLGTMLQRALGISALRAILTGLFSVGWVASQGPSAATRRLIRVLQESYGWLFIALALLLLLAHDWWSRRRVAAPPAVSPAPAQP